MPLGLLMQPPLNSGTLAGLVENPLRERRRDLARVVEALRLVCEGQASRSSVTSLTRQLWPESAGQGSPFPGNGTASTIFDSIWNIEQQIDGEYVLRESDLAQYLIWIREGDCLRGLDRLISVEGTPATLANRLGIPTVRYWVDGLGWHESFSVASPFTGRRFIGTGHMTLEDERSAVDIHTHQPNETNVFGDLFDTLVIDSGDLIQSPDLVVQQWDLWRQDDNGVRVLMASFTGRAKADAALEHFEGLGHKQTYWLESPNGAG
jgi:hypothetical protein